MSSKAQTSFADMPEFVSELNKRTSKQLNDDWAAFLRTGLLMTWLQFCADRTGRTDLARLANDCNRLLLDLAQLYESRWIDLYEGRRAARKEGADDCS